MFARFGATAALVCALAAPSAEAAQGWYWSKRKPGKKNWGVSLELGVRYETHYNREYVITTIPSTILGEVQMTYWNRNIFGLYVSFGKSVSQAETTTMGGGLKVPFLTAAGTGMGVSMMLVGDVVKYDTRDPILPEVFNPSQITVRYGGAINWKFGKTGLFLNTTAMVHSISDNFFIAPFVGLGFHF